MRHASGAYYVHETDSIYVDRKRDRFVVSLVVGYADEDLKPSIEVGDEKRDDEYWDTVTTKQRAKLAAKAALDLTQDAGSSDTVWFVYDRQEGVSWQFEQSEFEGDPGV